MRMILLLMTTLFYCFTINGEEMYDEKYDNIIIEDILGNKRLLLAYIKCILDKGKCTAEGSALKCRLNKIFIDKG